MIPEPPPPWWVISESTLLAMLNEVWAGSAPVVVYCEHYVAARREGLDDG